MPRSPGAGSELERFPAGPVLSRGDAVHIAATDLSWLEGAGNTIEDVNWVHWYAPEEDLEVRYRYADPWTDLGVTELSAYELVE